MLFMKTFKLTVMGRLLCCWVMHEQKLTYHTSWYKLLGCRVAHALTKATTLVGSTAAVDWIYRLETTHVRPYMLSEGA